MKDSKILPRRELKRSTPLVAKAPMKRSRKPSTPARKSAKGQPCLLNVADVCNYDRRTTILAHLRWLGDCGMGSKPPDEQGVYACSACNTWTDSPTPRQTKNRVLYEAERDFYASRALVRMRILDREKAT